MDKANIIISVIIVLCIAAAVAAYGITNSDNPIFSDLSSMSSNNNGNGLGNNTTNPTNTSSVAVTNGGGSSNAGSGSGASSGSSYGGSGSSSSSSASSYDSGSSNSGSNSNSGSSSSGTSLSYSSAQSIANSAVGEPGCYAGSVYYSGGYWYATIYDEDGNAVDSIMISDATGSVSRG